jgi:hypothetical protein
MVPLMLNLRSLEITCPIHKQNLATLYFEPSLNCSALQPSSTVISQVSCKRISLYGTLQSTSKINLEVATDSRFQTSSGK